MHIYMIIQQMGVILKTSKLNNENLAYRFKLSRMHNNWTGRTKEKIVLESQKKNTPSLVIPIFMVISMLCGFLFLFGFAQSVRLRPV
jgi:hypothetical protein